MQTVSAAKIRPSALRVVTSRGRASFCIFTTFNEVDSFHNVELFCYFGPIWNFLLGCNRLDMTATACQIS